MTINTAQFGDDDKVENTNKINYLEHIKAGIEVLNSHPEVSDIIKVKIDNIFDEYSLETIQTDLSAVDFFKKETNQKILNIDGNSFNKLST